MNDSCCPVCDGPVIQNAPGYTKIYCCKQCKKAAVTARRIQREAAGIAPDESRRFPEPEEPAETVNVRGFDLDTDNPRQGYDLAPEHARRMRELLRKKEAAGWV